MSEYKQQFSLFLSLSLHSHRWIHNQMNSTILFWNSLFVGDGLSVLASGGDLRCCTRNGPGVVSSSIFLEEKSQVRFMWSAAEQTARLLEHFPWWQALGERWSPVGGSNLLWAALYVSLSLFLALFFSHNFLCETCLRGSVFSPPSPLFTSCLTACFINSKVGSCISTGGECSLKPHSNGSQPCCTLHLLAL